MERAIAEEARLKVLLARHLRAVRFKPETPHGLAVLVAAERIERLGLDEWRNRARLAGGPRVSRDTAFSFSRDILMEDSPEALRMRKALIVEDAAA